MQIAVLGGGLSGLGAAHALAHRFPAAQLLLFERGKRLGGWAHSLRHGRILLEGGPRTLRPNGAAALELVRPVSSSTRLRIDFRTDQSPRHRGPAPCRSQNLSGLQETVCVHRPRTAARPLRPLRCRSLSSEAISLAHYTRTTALCPLQERTKGRVRRFIHVAHSRRRHGHRSRQRPHPRYLCCRLASAQRACHLALLLFQRS